MISSLFLLKFRYSFITLVLFDPIYLASNELFSSVTFFVAVFPAQRYNVCVYYTLHFSYIFGDRDSDR